MRGRRRACYTWMYWNLNVLRIVLFDITLFDNQWIFRPCNMMCIKFKTNRVNLFCKFLNKLPQLSKNDVSLKLAIDLPLRWPLGQAIWASEEQVWRLFRIGPHQRMPPSKISSMSISVELADVCRDTHGTVPVLALQLITFEKWHLFNVQLYIPLCYKIRL